VDSVARRFNVCLAAVLAAVVSSAPLLAAGCRSEPPTGTTLTSNPQTSASPPAPPFQSLSFPRLPPWEAAAYSLGNSRSWRAHISIEAEIPDGTGRRELVIKDAGGPLVIQLSWYRRSPMLTTADLIEWQEGSDTLQAKLGMLDWRAAIDWLDALIPVSVRTW
jgi:hypothetical protein